MKPESKFPTKEQCEELKSLGIKGTERTTDGAPMPDCAELGVMLPGELDPDQMLSCEKTDELPTDEPAMWFTTYRDWFSRMQNNPIEVKLQDTEAQSRAALLIALLESGRITAESVNARLQSA